MSKILAKSLRDALKEKRVIAGARQTLNSIKSASLVVCSRSDSETMQDIIRAAEKEDVPVLRYNGTSVDLGKICRLQFRVSALSISNADPSIIQSVIRESEQPAK